jgi:hypothetical protein
MAKSYNTKLTKLEPHYSEIIKRYQEVKKLIVVANEFNTSTNLVSRVLAINNINVKKIRKNVVLDEAEVVKSYDEIRNAQIVAKNFNVSPKIILNILHKNNVTLTKIKYTDEEIIQKYYEYKTIAKVSKSINVSEYYISNILTKNNVTHLSHRRVMVGDVFGMLTVESVADHHITPSGYEVKRFLCRCECGGTRIVTGTKLVSLNENITDCGCIFKKKQHEWEIKREEKRIKRLEWEKKQEEYRLAREERKLKKAEWENSISKIKVGFRRGKLTYTEIRGIGNDREVIALCDCGNTKVLKNQQIYIVRSCGCLREENRREATIIHNQSSKNDKHRRSWYDRWRSMVKRCYNPKTKSYKNYGARGIKVCDRWLEPNGVGSENYYKDIHEYLGPQPSKEHSLDRIDNDGIYEITNLRWATNSEQSKNQRRFKD